MADVVETISHMTICYFGTYNPKYPRNRVLIEGLRKRGVTVIECNSRRPGVWKYLSLVVQFVLKARNADAIIVGFPMGREVVTLLKSFDRLRMTRGVSVIIDGFVSQYDAEVFDRKHFVEDSREAKQLFNREQDAFRYASKVLVDTNANAEYYSKLFSIPLDHFTVIPVGTDEALFQPNNAHNKTCIVHFSGTYNSLQGIDVIVRAIGILKDQPVRFRLVGNGEEYTKIVQLSKELDVFDRIEFVTRVPYDEYARLMREADICLGIFGGSPKAGRVIANKVVEAIACGRAIITADSPATRELLTDGQNALLCKPNDPVDVSKKILELYQNESLRLKLGENARKVFLDKLSTEKIGKLLVEILQGICL